MSQHHVIEHKVSPPNTWAIEDDISRVIIYVHLQVIGTGAPKVIFSLGQVEKFPGVRPEEL